MSVEEHRRAQNAATVRGAIEGTVGSAAAAFAGSYILQRRSAAFRNLPGSLKALGFVIIVAPCLTIQAERRGLEYEKSKWGGEGMRILDEKQMHEDARWQALTPKQKVGDWASRHQYSIIMGSWAASLAVAGLIISRDKYQSTPQKVVQARMWAQGLTIGILIAAGAMTHSQRAESAKHINTDHSWKDLLDQQERDRKIMQKQQDAAAAAHAPAPA